jgi:hypothetical protein
MIGKITKNFNLDVFGVLTGHRPPHKTEGTTREHRGTTVIGQGDSGNGMLTTFSSAGKSLVELGSTDDDFGMLITRSSAGKSLVELTSTTTYEGMLNTYSSSIRRLAIRR